MGLLYGVYGGRSDGFQPGSFSVCNQPYQIDFFLGGASYETGFCPHGGMLPLISCIMNNFGL
jgi:homogentisate 1,2-dioxygenase